MNYLVINGVPAWDGEYAFDSFSDGTNREYHRIKEISGGIRAGELVEALSAGDTGAWVAFTVMILSRHGKNSNPDDFWDAPENAIQVKVGDDDADPPTQPPSSDGSSGNESSSGPSSESGSV